MAEIFASKTAEIEEREVINAQISRKLAGECMVLLENDGALPIHTKKVALFGNGARATIKGGTGSGDVNTRNKSCRLKGIYGSCCQRIIRSYYG